MLILDRHWQSNLITHSGRPYMNILCVNNQTTKSDQACQMVSNKIFIGLIPTSVTDQRSNKLLLEVDFFQPS